MFHSHQGLVCLEIIEKLVSVTNKVSLNVLNVRENAHFLIQKNSWACSTFILSHCIRQTK